jgi:hypothetical protein
MRDLKVTDTLISISEVEIVKTCFCSARIARAILLDYDGTIILNL